ncbi:HK97 family phage prohead protease [Burkholderia pseudomallei]|uniref:Caudovirus prohead protease, putative n=2 Tax=Burkholderia pseudomallei TaxID=28450 RepID=Q3JTI5_BURP1|nr:HK97 family phage prohead protease [Burkholderia pseudomallei]ABA49860.1 Caudovirus prohead protease, putative [Burkholderia pseudomallei 1710b]AIS48670.1 caudovirus prohead protease family protein [Burkholderia pseudomallei]EET09132.1 putative caudovirus prohead protease [Burkholderia pseudomallei 1710a]KGC49073.1 caudovirus prohead protease family protein [Burkholderia pseudomallei]KGD20224.1 caudovirus prohead protease family protein [Burkholderia pseudomallei]
MQKSFSSIEIKSVQEDRREIEGIASTPTPDRVNDVVEPLGLTFQKETPLLLNHKSDQPVGTVQFGTPTAKGLPFKAKIAKVDEEGVVKQRTDEAWHSVKTRLIRGVSIGFIARATSPLPNGGTRFTKAEVHELSLTAIPANPEAKITGFKALPEVPDSARSTLDLSILPPELAAMYTAGLARREAEQKAAEAARKEQETINTKEENDMQKTNNTNHIFIRGAIAKAVTMEGGAEGYASMRWGAGSKTVEYIKAIASPMTAGVDGSGALTSGTLSRQQFVQAVFSHSILGQLRGVIRVPAMTRVNVENEPTAAAFFGPGVPCPTAQGTFGVHMADKRKIGVTEVISEELARATDEAAEVTISAILQRALSRGLDNAFIGSQTRGEVSPAGLGTVAVKAANFEAGLEVFTGDLTMASVIVNPRTAVALRSPTETQITATGGIYKGLPAIASCAVPLGKLLIVDGSRVLAHIGDVEILALRHADVYTLHGGASPSVPVNMFQTNQVALQAGQYADWDFVDGAAIEVGV